MLVVARCSRHEKSLARERVICQYSTSANQIGKLDDYQNRKKRVAAPRIEAPGQLDLGWHDAGQGAYDGYRKVRHVADRHCEAIDGGTGCEHQFRYVFCRQASPYCRECPRVALRGYPNRWLQGWSAIPQS